jgi:hypothetical protein
LILCIRVRATRGQFPSSADVERHRSQTYRERAREVGGWRNGEGGELAKEEEGKNERERERAVIEHRVCA